MMCMSLGVYPSFILVLKSAMSDHRTMDAWLDDLQVCIKIGSQTIS